MLDSKKNSISAEEQEFHSSIGVLSGEVARLQDEKTALISEIVNYKDNLEKYKAQKLLLDELIDIVDRKKAFIDSMNKEIDILVLSKNDLLVDVSGLETKVSEKSQLTADVEKLKKNIATIQQDMKTFENNFSEKKSSAETNLKNIKNKMKEFHDMVGTVIDTI